MSRKKEQKKRQNYLDRIYNIREYSEREFDRLIVYFASGGLVFTTAFVKDIIDIKTCTNTTLLKLSWIFFTISLIVILITHLTSRHSMNLEIKGKTCNSDLWDNFTKILNYTSFISLITAVTIFVVFLLKNI